MTHETATKALLDQLEAEGVAYELIPHVRTMTAIAEAKALGVEPQTVAKTIVLGTSRGPVRAVLAATDRLDLSKVREVLGEEERVELLTEDALADAYPEFELGAVPPIGGGHEDRVLVDIRVVEQEHVLLEAGTHDQSVRIAARDLVAHRSALIADIHAD